MKRPPKPGLCACAVAVFLSGAPVFGSATGAAAADAQCRLALAIGLDISGSVDDAEYRLQLDGLAGALLDQHVQAAFLAIPDARVRLFVFEWAGYGSKRPLLPWTDVADASDLEQIAAGLLATARRPHDPATALGRAMEYGAAALAEQNDCWRLVMDLSGDGTSNMGPEPGVIRDQPPLADITVNALVVGADAPRATDRRASEIAELSSYFRQYVIRGPDAFVVTALRFEDFQDAMTRKLLKELQTRAVSGAPQPVP